MKKFKQLFAFFTISVLTTGCASFGKGLAEAYFEKQDSVDTRICEVTGAEFEGIRPFLDNKHGTMKVLMVHGVGNHSPGYSTQFIEKLVQDLNLNVKSKKNKDIYLTDPLDTSKKLGNLRVHRLMNKKRNKEMLFYELTWSEITASQKEILAYDNSGEYSFRRAEVNDLMKKFSNVTGPDPIIYLGESRGEILIAFMQSLCWMINGKWGELPSDTSQSCTFDDLDAVDRMQRDHFAVVSHSLGSRITIDGMQLIATFLGDKTFLPELNRPNELVKALQEKEIPIYMMSNQLPMLQLGRKLPEINGQKDDYCLPEGANYDQRMLSKTPIIAFSDPNDLLSYAVPHGFVEKYLDSRLCIDVTNVNINVAKIFDAFGLGRLANPLDAHVGYDTDDRVVAMIANGVGNDNAAKIVNERCSWIETID